MQMKTIAMMAAVGCAMSMLTGCGVPKQEHDAKISELNMAWQEIETLKGKNTDLESLLAATNTKLKTSRIELEDATGSLSVLQAKQNEIASELTTEKSKNLEIESELSSTKSEAMQAQEVAAETEAALAKLKEDYKKLEARFEQFSKNMRGLDGGKAAPIVSDPSKSDSEAAMDLLNQMSTQ